MIAHSMLSLGTCCLVNPDKKKTVEHAFALVNRMSQALTEIQHLDYPNRCA